jgi:PTH1 family peptidyl-tRNA hydrolase
MQKGKVEKKNLLVVLDDVNLPFGKQRIRPKGSDGGHNGLKDIDQLTGGNNYARLRIGIGSDFPKGQQAEFVLSPWTDEELEQLPEIIKTATETITSFGTIGIQHTMNQFNKK